MYAGWSLSDLPAGSYTRLLDNTKPVISFPLHTNLKVQAGNIAIPFDPSGIEYIYATSNNFFLMNTAKGEFGGPITWATLEQVKTFSINGTVVWHVKNLSFYDDYGSPYYKFDFVPAPFTITSFTPTSAGPGATVTRLPEPILPEQRQ